MSRLLAFFRARTPDHRGTLRDLMPVRHLNCTPQAHSPLPLRTRNRIYMTLNRTPGGRLNTTKTPLDGHAVALLVIGVSIAFMTVILLPSSPLFAGMFGILLPRLLIVIPVVVIAATLSIVSIRSRATRIADAIAAEGYCPSCAYPLAEIEKAHDGCTICPECGAAWRVSAREPNDPSAPAQP